MTSILSKRWRLLWSLVPILDFGDESLPNEKYKEPTQAERHHDMSFEQFMYSVLDLQKAQPNNCIPFNVKNWANEAI